jgi:hypothetical protein
MISKCALEPSTRSCIPEVDLPLLSSLEASGYYKMLLFLSTIETGMHLSAFRAPLRGRTLMLCPNRHRAPAWRGARMEGQLSH